MLKLNKQNDLNYKTVEQLIMDMTMTAIKYKDDPVELCNIKSNLENLSRVLDEITSVTIDQYANIEEVLNSSCYQKIHK